MKKLVKLATPILIAQVAQTSMGFVDTVMAGDVSATDMGAVAVAASIWLPTILFGLGLVMALVPIIATLNGSGKKNEIPFQVQQGFYLAAIISIPIMLLMYNAGVLIDMRDNIEPLLKEKTIGYLHAVMWSAPAFLGFIVLRSFAEGCSYTKPAMIIAFIGLAANVPLNWIFVYGHFGLPKLGGVGCGVATALVYWIMFFAMLAYMFISKKLSRIGIFKNWQGIDFKAQWRLMRLGFPVAAAIFFEVTLFAVVAFLIAPLGSITVAAHQVAANFSSMIFIIPMSIGSAASIRVSYQLGERKIEGARISSYCALGLGLAIATVTALLTFLLRAQIADLYSDNLQVMALASQLMLLACIYQWTDSIQVIGAGILRGYKDMQAIFVRTFIAYWIFGLPTGYILGLTDWVIAPIGPFGFWWGFIVGLTVAAILLGQRLLWLQRQPESVQLNFSAR
nr:MATE family efflux transporter [Vibrio stylophorae]